MLSIITVNYNSKKYLINLIKSIQEKIGKEKIELIIVNNEKTPLKIPFFNLKIKIINQGKNTGFGKASNFGVKKAKGKWLFFLNPDVEIIDQSLKKALAFAKKDKNISIIGPQIIEKKTGKPQVWSCGRKTSFFQIIFKNTFNKPWNKKKPTEVDWVSGSSLLIKKEDFEKVSGFDEKFFMYFEDQDLCLRIKKNNKKIFFYPEFKIIHYGGKSWSDKKNQKKFYYHSQDIFFKKHHNFLSQFSLKIIRKIFKGI